MVDGDRIPRRHWARQAGVHNSERQKETLYQTRWKLTIEPEVFLLFPPAHHGTHPYIHMNAYTHVK